LDEIKSIQLTILPEEISQVDRNAIVIVGNTFRFEYPAGSIAIGMFS
jgi:hypothetical protein